MDIFVRALLFFFAAGLLWIFAGILIEAVNAVAKRYKRNGFTVAFFVLGFLTSIEEIAVMVSSSIDGVPQISAGNLIGASIVLLFFVIPILAMLGKEVRLQNTLSKKQLIAALVVIVLPAILLLDGNVTKSEGLLCLLSYVALAYLIRRGKWWWQRKRDTIPEVIEEVEEELVSKHHATRRDVLKIFMGTVIIFLAGFLLVLEATFFSDLLGVPNSVLGLLVLPIGTNLAELVIAIRALLKGSVDIAFGNYLGSAVANTLIFAFLALWEGAFAITPKDFYSSTILLFFGAILFYVFANSKSSLSRREGIMLFSFYIIFVLAQFATIFLGSPG